MNLPNADRAVVEIEKLKDYCLSRSHPRGRHKAKVFASRLGITASDAEELRQILLTAARSSAVRPAETDQYGDRYVVDYPIERHGNRAIIRSGWIVRAGEDFPRLTSCYVLQE